MSAVEAAERDPLGRLAAKRCLGEVGGAGRQRELPEIGRRAGQRLIAPPVGQRLLQEARRLEQVGHRPVDGLGGTPEARQVGGADRRGAFAKLGDEAEHMLAAGLRQLAGDEVDRLDAVGALIDRRDAGVAIEARRAGLLDEAHAAMHLHAERGYLDAGIGGERLGDRRQQVGAVLPMARRVAIAGMRHVDRMGAGIADGARDARSAPSWSGGRAARRDGGRSAPCPRRCMTRPCPAGAHWRRRCAFCVAASATATPWMPTARRALFIIVNMQARPRFSSPTSQPMAPGARPLAKPSP